MDTHYGPTETDPRPGAMWHYDCGGEVFGYDNGLICDKCGEQEELETSEPEAEPASS